MNHHDENGLKNLAEKLAKTLAEFTLPPGELSVRIYIEKDWSGDREVNVTFQDKPRQLYKFRRRDPNPIEGHKLAGLPFMRPKSRA